MNTTFNRPFYFSLYWNALEALGYQAIFIGHHLMLFAVSSLHFFGVVGTIFSLIYLGVTITNFGLYETLGAFFSRATETKRTAILHLAPQLLINFIVALSASIGCMFFPLQNNYLSKYSLVLIGGILFFESLKKNLRSIAYLAFYSRAVALIEVITMTSYVGLVWGYYILYKNITLHVILVPMFLYAIIGTLLLAHVVYYWYMTLSTSTDNASVIIPAWHIVKQRWYAFLNQMSHQLFSSNILIPFLAASSGFATAGTYKIVSYISYGITNGIKKMFGTSSYAFLAHNRFARHADKQDAFTLIKNNLNRTLIYVSMFALISYYPLSSRLTAVNPPLMYMIFLLHMSENFFIAYEKLFLTHEYTGILLAFSSATIIVGSAIIYFTVTFPPAVALLGLIFLRASSALGMHWYTKRILHLK